MATSADPSLLLEAWQVINEMVNGQSDPAMIFNFTEVDTYRLFAREGVCHID